MLVAPGHVVWNVHRASAKLEDRQDVGTQRVAHHHELVGFDPAAREYPPIGADILLAQDLDPEKQAGQAGPRQLALLIEEIALGDQEEVVALAKPAQRGLDAFEELSRLRQHSLAPAEDVLEVGRRNPPLSELDRGFDHRKGERFDAVAVNSEVLHLGLKKMLVDIDIGHMALQKVAELALCDVEPVLVVPQRVVAIETHDRDRHEAPLRAGGN